MKKLVTAIILALLASTSYAITITPSGNTIGVTMTTGPKGDKGDAGPATAITDSTSTTSSTTAASATAVKAAYDLANGKAAANLTGTTTSIGGGALTAGTCTSGTVAVAGATTGMAVSASPVAYPGDGVYWQGYVSASNTVTVKVCGAVSVTPTATTYNVRVLQ